MPDKFDYRPGVYKILVDRLQIRGTPNSEQSGNIVRDNRGAPIRFTLGQAVPVYRIHTTEKGWIWGVINQADKDRFICLWNLNTRFAELVQPFGDDVRPVSSLENLENRLVNLEAWARTKGYMG